MTQLVAFRTNSSRYRFLGETQLINAYAEKQDQDAKGPLAVLPADGLVEFAEVTDTPCRGTIYLPDLDVAYSFHSSSVYKVTSAGTETYIGTIPGIDPVQISRNQKATPQIVVRCTAGLYMIENDVVSLLNDSDILGAVVTQDHIGGYTTLGFVNRQFQLSSLNESSEYDGLDFATFEQKAGKLVRVVANAGALYGFCDRWCEIWQVTGNADFPIEPSSAPVIEKGLLAANGITPCDNTLFFVGHDGIVYRLQGAQPLRVSNHDVERNIQDDADQSSISAFSWSRGGHAFATFSGSTWTRSFDANTGVWHTRSSYPFDYWRACYPFFAWGKVIVGDKWSGKLFYLDSDAFTEDDQTMIWGVDFPPMHTFHNGGIVDAVHFDLAVGYGDQSSTSQGFDPKVMLSWSVDGGNTFGTERILSLGQRGQYRTRVTSRRLGSFGPQGIVFRLRISDPVVRALVNTDVDVRPLKL